MCRNGEISVQHKPELTSKERCSSRHLIVIYNLLLLDMKSFPSCIRFIPVWHNFDIGAAHNMQQTFGASQPISLFEPLRTRNFLAHRSSLF